MLIVAIKPGHDGTIAAIDNDRLLFSLESEKDSYRRYSTIQPHSILEIAEQLGELPDVVALSGWQKQGFLGGRAIGAGYWGADAAEHRPSRFFGKHVTFFTDSHERSHILGTIGMAPRDDAPVRAVLVWEGMIGRFYLVEQPWKVTREIRVIGNPGIRYAMLFSIADPRHPDRSGVPSHEAAGKLMALAGFGDPARVEGAYAEAVERLATGRPIGNKGDWRDTPFYNIGVEAQETKDAAALLTNRLFELYADAALAEIPPGLPLYINGGCGLNCEWNARWRDLGHFSSIFVPPCTNDTGSAIGTAIDARAELTGEAHIGWSVYAGLEFERDTEPDPAIWRRTEMTDVGVAQALDEGRIVAWVQGRWEIGPRALGNRSILAEPARPETKDRLNEIKQREDYRPIAPCCRVEDLTKAFAHDYEDPYMLFFNTVRADGLQAVTHVDGTARVQTVRASQNERLHRLLTAFAERRGIGVLCNTSLNFKGQGFINRMSDLVKYCEDHGIDDMVVGDDWFQRVQG
jgi:hydroxymethyl cephem carbamoyltransferase